MGYGDTILVSGRARAMQQTDPRKVRVTYQGIHKAGRWDAVLQNNPRIAKVGERGDFQELQARDMANNRPYHTGKTPERWYYNLNFRPDVGEVYFSPSEIEFGKRHAGRIVLEPHIKPGASPNKSWGWMRWNKLSCLMGKAGLRVTQIGPPGTQLLECADLVETATFREACAVLENARAAVLPEGGTMHAAAALGIPGVAIFGGFTPIELTGYPMHIKFGASLGEACGMRLPCAHCSKWMESIKPDQVFAALCNVLDNSGQRILRAL